MYFNFPLFTRLATKAYNTVKDNRGQHCYELDDVLNVFRYYFQRYEDCCHDIHPNICMEQIERIIERMPYLDGDYGGSLSDIDPDSYEVLIDKHFQTKYNKGRGGCDYNINHFFSGAVRDLRFYEELY